MPRRDSIWARRIQSTKFFFGSQLSAACFRLISFGDEALGVADRNDIGLLRISDYAADSEPDSCGKAPLPVFPAPDGCSGSYRVHARTHPVEQSIIIPHDVAAPG